MHPGIYMPRFPPSFLFDKQILRSYIIAHTAFDTPNLCVFCEVKQMEAKKCWSETFRAAFPHTLPVMTGYLVLSLAYGVLMQSKGYGPLWSTLTSALAYSGSMQYAAVILFAGSFDPLAALVLSITINARYIFCSVGMLNRFSNTGLFKPFLFFALSDESFALASTLDVPVGMDKGRFYFAMFLLDYSYWVLGTLAGGLIGQMIRFSTAGLDFALTAMYAALFIDLLCDRSSRISGVIGLVCTVLSLFIFGSGNVVIPAMVLIIIVLVAGRRKIA